MEKRRESKTVNFPPDEAAGLKAGTDKRSPFGEVGDLQDGFQPSAFHMFIQNWLYQLNHCQATWTSLAVPFSHSARQRGGDRHKPNDTWSPKQSKLGDRMEN